MNVYKIQMAPRIHEQLGHPALTYLKEAQAVGMLETAFKLNAIKYTINKEESKICFLNEHGGTIATIIPEFLPNL